MPLYDFKCTGCGIIWEDLVRSDQSSFCPKCKAKGTKLLPQRIETRYRGKGFYSTDYKS